MAPAASTTTRPAAAGGTKAKDRRGNEQTPLSPPPPRPASFSLRRFFGRPKRSAPAPSEFDGGDLVLPVDDDHEPPLSSMSQLPSLLTVNSSGNGGLGASEEEDSRLTHRMLGRLSLGSPTPPQTVRERSTRSLEDGGSAHGSESMRTLGSILPSSRELADIGTDSEVDEEDHGGGTGRHSLVNSPFRPASQRGAPWMVTSPAVSHRSSTAGMGDGGPTAASFASPSKRAGGGDSTTVHRLSSPQRSDDGEPLAPVPLHELPTVVHRVGGMSPPPHRSSDISLLEEGEEEGEMEEEEDQVSIEADGLEVGGDGPRAAAEWSDDDERRGAGCGVERCTKERRHLRRLVAELRMKLETAEEAARKQNSEILDLRQQVTMLSGFGEPVYESSYDVVDKELAAAANSLARSGAFAGHRIKHQRINPALIIKEKDIIIEKIVGVGSFGKVWKGIYESRPVAIKCFYSEDADVIGEINLMERVNGRPHVLKLEGVYLSNDTGEEAQVALVMPYMENGSLYDVLVNEEAPQHRASVSMNTIVKMAMQTADGVRALHRENVIHRDLACRNILVDGDLNVYVSDFGFARQKENMTGKSFTKTNMGPVKWEAPESLQHKEYSEKTDAFSYAVCLFEMVSQKEPWAEETHAQVAYQVICGQRLPIALNCDPTVAEIMDMCWQQDPRKRPNFEYIFRRLKERHTQLQNEEREIAGEKQLFTQLRQGTTFYKLPYLKGKPHKRQFKVSEDLRRLKWCFLPTRNFMQRARDPVRPATKQVFLTEVQDIRMGMRTANFKRVEGVEKFRGRAAFSIITQERTIDILCPTAEIMDQWVLGLRFLVDRLRPPPSSLSSPPLMDHWSVMAHLRRGGFLLKFGQIGRAHERYFRVAANMKQMLWTSGETPGKGVHKSVDLTKITAVRLFRHATPGVAAVAPSLNLLSKGVDDYQFGFSLVNQQGQADINLVAPNAIEYMLWTRGFEMIVRYFQDEDKGVAALAAMVAEQQAGEGEAKGAEPLHHPPPVYDRGDYLAIDMAKLGALIDGKEGGGGEKKPPPPTQQHQQQQQQNGVVSSSLPSPPPPPPLSSAGGGVARWKGSPLKGGVPEDSPVYATVNGGPNGNAACAAAFPSMLQAAQEQGGHAAAAAADQEKEEEDGEDSLSPCSADAASRSLPPVVVAPVAKAQQEEREARSSETVPGGGGGGGHERESEPWSRASDASSQDGPLQHERRSSTPVAPPPPAPPPVLRKPSLMVFPKEGDVAEGLKPDPVYADSSTFLSFLQEPDKK